LQWLSEVQATQNTSNRTAYYNNNTPSAFVSGQTTGVFAIDSTEEQVTTGKIVDFTITYAGSGYSANAAVTISGGGGSGATANAFVNVTSNAGRVTLVNANQAGTGFKTNPDISIAAPSAVNITANSVGFSNTNDTLAVTTANSRFQAGDKIYYSVPAANTPIAPLTGNTYYYISFANTTTVKLAATPGGANIDITDARTTATGEVHTIRGETATAEAVIGGTQTVGATAGWNLRRVGTGGRAGRVQMECLVAMRTIATDGSDDAIIHDS
jgi:hypothetical protein